MYKSLADKGQAFFEFVVDTEAGLNYIIEHFKNKPCLRFRGVNEAKYTMITSLQRLIQLPFNDQKSYMTTLLQQVKSEPDVITFFQNRGIAVNDMSCLALMQHFGLPTPLLDFSTDISVALSFAADGVKKTGNDETDDYVSLYVFDKAFEFEVGMSLQQVYMQGMTSGYQAWQDYMRQHPGQPIDASILYNINDFVKWNDIKDFEFMYIEYQAHAPGVTTLSGQTLDLSNPNLTRQKGCFILNLYNDSMPLEENWNGRTTSARNQFWQNRVPGVRTLPFSGVMTRDKLVCYDIRKEVISRWASANAIKLYDNSPEVVALKGKLSQIKKSLGI